LLNNRDKMQHLIYTSQPMGHILWKHLSRGLLHLLHHTKCLYLISSWRQSSCIFGNCKQKQKSFSKKMFFYTFQFFGTF
jgi:hypothetical protein